jgi:hypothetical protein
MFQRFLDAEDYWFGCSDDSSAGSYDTACECFVVVVDDQADGTNAVGAGDREALRNQGTSVPQNPGPSAPPPCQRGALTSTRSWLKRENSRLSSRRSTARYDCFAPPSLEKLPRAASVRVSWASRPVSTSTPTSTSTTEHAPASESESHRRRDAAASHACSLYARGAEPAPRGAGAHRAGSRAIGRSLASCIR